MARLIQIFEHEKLTLLENERGEKLFPLELEKLYEFKQSPLEENLKCDLLPYAKTLHEDPDLLKSLRILNPDIAKQMERLFREQKRLKEFDR